MSERKTVLWFVDGAEGEGLRILADDERHTIIAELGPFSNSAAQAEACLIASAPDLLEALRAMVKLEDLGIGYSRQSWSSLTYARDAIAKAEGRAKEFVQ